MSESGSVYVQPTSVWNRNFEYSTLKYRIQSSNKYGIIIIIIIIKLRMAFFRLNVRFPITGLPYKILITLEHSMASIGL